MAYTTIVAGTTITASWGNSDVRDQVVVAFASTSARDSAITTPVVGMLEYLKTNGSDEGLTTRTSAATWRKPWNLVWGQLAYAQATTAQTGITSLTDLTSLTVTATVPANRYLRTTLWIGQTTNTGGTNNNLAFITDGSNVVKQTSAVTIPAASGVATLPAVFIETSSAGAVTRKGRMQAVPGTAAVSASATQPAFISLEDIGPAGAPA